jgi:MYXO-CTERM domain-containing protein
LVKEQLVRVFPRNSVVGLAAIAITALSPLLAHASLISVDYGPSISTPTNFSGVESAAAGVNSLFSAASTWNHLQVVDYYLPATPSPTFANLVDSTGAATGVSLSITGAVKAFDGATYFPPNVVGAVDALRQDYLFFNSSNNTQTSIDWAISGLSANTEYSFYAYGARADQARLFDMLVDTNGDGLLSDETAMQLGSTGFDLQHYQDAYFSNVLSDASGVIHGRGIGLTLEANWGGFQLVPVTTSSVPEPGTFALAGLALLGAAAARRRKV